MRPNRKYQQHIRYALSDMLLIKERHLFHEPMFQMIENMPYHIAPDDKITVTLSPKACAHAAKRFVEQAYLHGYVDEYNQRVYYYPTINQRQETGIITYLELLLAKNVF